LLFCSVGTLDQFNADDLGDQIGQALDRSRVWVWITLPAAFPLLELGRAVKITIAARKATNTMIANPTR
jgi:hypothetical protein